MLHCADSMRTGESKSILDCHELQTAMHDDLLQSLLLSLWDADVPEARIDRRSTPADKRSRNRVLAQQARSADKEYVDLMLKELHRFTETFEMYADYIAELKVDATAAVSSMLSLEEICAQNRTKIKILEESDKGSAAEPMPEIPRKLRNRIHAQNSRKRKHDFVEDLIKQRDESWTTMQEVMQYTTALESACSVLNDFDDTGTILLQLTETRQRLLMRTSAHKQKCEELQSRLSYRAMLREKMRRGAL